MKENGKTGRHSAHRYRLKGSAVPFGEEILQKTREISRQYKLEGYHCSETVIRTLNDVFELKMNDDVLRCACGFRGGGGGYRDRCGILEAGMMAISYIYGRNDVTGDIEGCSYLIRTLHERFREHFDTIRCLDIYTKQKEMNVPNTCLDPTMEGSVLVAEVLLEAEELLKNISEEE